MTLDELIKQLYEVKKRGMPGDAYISVYQDGTRHAICDSVPIDCLNDDCIDINLEGPAQ